MVRALLAAVALAALPASATASSYSATLVTPATARFIASDIIWHCGPAACQGATEQSRPLVLCQSLTKLAGAVKAFTVDGRALGAAELDRCNASAKAAAAAKVAAQ
jgi:hypothetical protein